MLSGLPFAFAKLACRVSVVKHQGFSLWYSTGLPPYVEPSRAGVAVVFHENLVYGQVMLQCPAAHLETLFAGGDMYVGSVSREMLRVRHASHHAVELLAAVAARYAQHPETAAQRLENVLSQSVQVEDDLGGGCVVNVVPRGSGRAGEFVECEMF